MRAKLTLTVSSNKNKGDNLGGLESRPHLFQKFLRLLEVSEAYFNKNYCLDNVAQCP